MTDFGRFNEEIESLVHFARPLSIIEVGSWQGASIIAMVKTARKLGLDPTAVCIDTWLGSVEHWLNRFPNSEWSFDNLAVKDGEPHVLSKFKANVSAAGLDDAVSILRADSAVGLKYLQRNKHVVDLIYIDGDHAYEAVRRDLAHAMKFWSLSHKVVVAGDDWNWRSVRKAVMVTALLRGLRLFVYGNTWLLLSEEEEILRLDIPSKWLRWTVGRTTIQLLSDESRRIFSGKSWRRTRKRKK